jgi:transposase
MTLTEKRLQKIFNSSALILQKLPNEKERESFLQKLFTLSDLEKRYIIQILEDYEQGQEEGDEKALQKIAKHIQQIEKIKTEAKKVHREIEDEKRDEAAEDILKEL